MTPMLTSKLDWRLVSGGVQALPDMRPNYALPRSVHAWPHGALGRFQSTAPSRAFIGQRAVAERGR
jgi:hypothetical protein